jgi:deoxyinosine 3'endonuclease (endonuclease V)
LDAVKNDRVSINNKREQMELKAHLITHDDFNWKLDSTDPATSLQYIGGVDISFIKDNDVDACASLIVLSYPQFEVQSHYNNLNISGSLLQI